MFSPANLPYWIFLATGFLLFLFIIFVGGGEENVEIESDIDLEIEAELETDISSDFSFGQLLEFAGLGKIPLMLLLAIDFSLWGLIGWMLNTWLDSLFPINGIWAVLVFVVSLILSLVIGRFIAKPISLIFAEFGEDTSSDRLIGCIGTVTSFYIPTAQENKIGQVDVIDNQNNFITISAVLPNWAKIAPQRGEKVIIIERQERVYLVLAKDSIDQLNWFNQLYQN